MKDRLQFVDRTLKRLTYDESLGPKGEEQGFVYELSLSDPEISKDGSVTVMVNAKLSGKREDLPKESKRDPFLDLSVELLFHLDKPTKADREKPSALKDHIDTYAKNVVGELAGNLLYTTSFRMPRFPR